jgi:branched-subunit amino acid aminotransferase/4-amino-4-deoxychorismate lyase
MGAITENASMQIVEIDGEPATPQDLHRVAVMNYGHFTSMQVREGRVYGFELHLNRLASSSAVLFDHALERERVRVLIRHALGTRASASVRVNVFAKNGDLSDPLHPVIPSVMVTLSDPYPSEPGSPWRLRTAVYERDMAEHKHVATMGLIYQRRLARAEGYDDVLFVDRQGRVAEGSIWNIALWDGQTVIFPSAAVLPGITMSLVGQGLQRIGVPVVTRPLLLQELKSMRAAAAMYSVCYRQPIGNINGTTYAVQDHFDALLQQAWAAVPADHT